MSKLKVDLELHRKAGMTILTAEQVRGRKTEVFAPWPKGRAFLPKGITLDEARDAMGRCHSGKTRICVQCRRKLSLAHFSVGEETKKANPGIERFCSTCWSCP